MMADDVTACERCGGAVRQVVTGRSHRPRKYCSSACKQAAYRARYSTREATRETLLAWAALPDHDHDEERV
jgi:hypothetical protein